MVPVTVAITELVQLRNPDSSIFGFGGDGDYYAAVKIGNNAEKNSTDHIISGSHIFPNWQFTDYVDDAAGPVQIHQDHGFGRRWLARHSGRQPGRESDGAHPDVLPRLYDGAQRQFRG